MAGTAALARWSAVPSSASFPTSFRPGQFSDVYFTDNVYGASMIAEGARIPPGLARYPLSLSCGDHLEDVIFFRHTVFVGGLGQFAKHTLSYPQRKLNSPPSF